jgi:hypothetical protein
MCLVVMAAAAAAAARSGLSHGWLHLHPHKAQGIVLSLGDKITLKQKG